MRYIVIAMLMPAMGCSGEDLMSDCGTNDYITVDAGEYVVDTLVLGSEIMIKLDTGEVSIPTNMTVSVASKAFWDDVMKHWGSKERVVKTLAESGEICKVYGHGWERRIVVDKFAGLIDVEASTDEYCRICNARKVTKTKTEIIPAKVKK